MLNLSVMKNPFVSDTFDFERREFLDISEMSYQSADALVEVWEKSYRLGLIVGEWEEKYLSDELQIFCNQIFKLIQDLSLLVVEESERETAEAIEWAVQSGLKAGISKVIPDPDWEDLRVEEALSCWYTLSPPVGERKWATSGVIWGEEEDYEEEEEGDRAVARPARLAARPSVVDPLIDFIEDMRDKVEGI